MRRRFAARVVLPTAGACALVAAVLLGVRPQLRPPGGREPSMPPPTEQLSPLKKLWRSRIIEDVAAFPDLTRAGFLHSLLLGAPWTIAVHVTDTKRIWVAPTPLPLTFAYAGHADVWLMYSAGTLTMLKLMASKAAALPNVSLIHLHTDNCLYGWRLAVEQHAGGTAPSAQNVSKEWSAWVGGAAAAPAPAFPPLTYQTSRWIPGSLDCRALPFMGYDWIWPGQDITQGSTSRLDGLVPWEQRRPVVIFRGTQKGDSIPFSGNWRSVRVRAATAALSHPDILDVKLYSHCVPPEARNCQNRDLNATLFGDTIPMERQFHYKYQLDIDGHGGTFRLKHLMLSGSLVFKVDSPLFQPWMLALVPWVHFVPVSWHDLEQDLPRKVQWARANDARAKQIMLNGRAFAMEAFKDDNTAWYMQQMLTQIAQQQHGFDMIDGSVEFCCRMLDGDPRLKHFYEKCLMYEESECHSGPTVRSLKEFFGI